MQEIIMTEIRRKFIHSKNFDEQWKSLGLNDDNLKELQTIENLSQAERKNIKAVIEQIEKIFEQEG